MTTGFVIGSEKILKLKYSVLINFALRREISNSGNFYVGLKF